MGPLNKVMEMLPGMGSILKEGAGRDSSQKIKSYMTIMDSMTDEGKIAANRVEPNLSRWPLTRASGMCTTQSWMTRRCWPRTRSPASCASPAGLVDR